MPIVATSTGRPTRAGFEEKGGHFTVSSYIGGSEPAEPQAFLVHELTSPGYVAPHFHDVRQFQVVVSKGARLGKRPVPGISFHYADPFTPYGPIVPGEEDPLAFFTLRPEKSGGTFFMPGSKEKMERKAGRNIAVQVPAASDAPAAGPEALVEGQEDGLAAFRVRLAPNATAQGVSTEHSGGQYYLVMGGSLLAEDSELDRLSLMWVGSDEAPPSLVAGSDGADLLVLQFPVKAG